MAATPGRGLRKVREWGSGGVMKYLLLLCPLLLLGTACGLSYESTCKDSCQQLDACAVMGPDLAACESRCDSQGEQATRDVDSGRVTQACYDAAVDLNVCIGGQSCDVLNSGDVPQECVPDIERKAAACGSE